MYKIASFDLNKVCSLPDEKIEELGDLIAKAFREGKEAFNKNLYILVAEISQKLMNRNMAKWIHELSNLERFCHYEISEKFIARYGKSKPKAVSFLKDFGYFMGDQHQILGWALCISASRFISRPLGWAEEPDKDSLDAINVTKKSKTGYNQCLLPMKKKSKKTLKTCTKSSVILSKVNTES